MERGRNELVGDLRLYDAALFHDAIRDRDSADPEQSDSRHDDESRADNRRHDRDDELERVVGSDLLWNRSS
jgi:hypothetical protein